MKKRRTKKKPPKKTYVIAGKVDFGEGDEIPIYLCKQDKKFYAKIEDQYTGASETFRSCQRNAKHAMSQILRGVDLTGIKVIFEKWTGRNERWTAGVIEGVSIVDRGEYAANRFGYGPMYWVRCGKKRHRVHKNALYLGTEKDAQKLSKIEADYKKAREQNDKRKEGLRSLNDLSRTAVMNMVKRVRKAA